MDAPSLAHTAHDSPQNEYTPRELRALRLVVERGDEVRRIAAGLYRVPSCTDSGSYDVRYGGEREECPCGDFQYGHGRACKHLLALGLMHGVARSGIKVRTIPAAGDPFAYAGDKPQGCALCMDVGFVFFGVEEDGEEEIERVPCKRCRQERR